MKLVRENKALIAILLIGIFVRTFLFGEIPAGLNQDEVSLGYDAYALLNYGIDRNGYHNPVILKAWGSGLNALSAYFLMPFIYIFSLNDVSVRLVNLVFGIISLIAFYLLIREISDKKLALVSTFLLAISPWHIMLSRWGLEANLLPAIFLLGVLFLVLGLKRQIYFPISFGLLGLALYAYGTAYFVVPLFVALSSAYLVFHKKIDLKMFLASLLTFSIVAFPILLLLVVNTYGTEPIETGLLSIPQLSKLRHEAVVSDEIIGNTYSFAKIIATGDDGEIFNQIPPYGYLYPFAFPLILLGLFSVVQQNRSVRKFQPTFFFLVWLILSAILAVVVIPEIQRINIIFLPLIFFAALGIVNIGSKFGDKAFWVLIALCLIAFEFFTVSYFTLYPQIVEDEFAHGGPWTAFYPHIGEAINYASESTTGLVCVTNRINQPSVFVLMYRKIDPNVFVNTVRYYNPGVTFQWVASFDRYRFGFDSSSAETIFYPGWTIENECVKRTAAAYVYYSFDQDKFKFDEGKFSITSFGEFSVAIERAI